MSQFPGLSSSAGKTPRERRRLSVEQPYKKARTSTPAMPATRRSPARPPPEAPNHEENSLPLASIMQELALLRKAMETRFTEADRKADSLRSELVGKLDANDKAVSELQLAVTDVTLGVDENQRAIHEVRAEVERREIELPGKVRAIVQEVLDGPRSRERPKQAAPPGQRHRPFAGASVDEQNPSGSRTDEAFDLARRSLRLWPVSREGDIDTRTREFLVNELLLEQEAASALEFSVKRSAGLSRPKDREPGSRVRDEVLVVFQTRRERDEVRSHARNLEKKGRGLRLEIPDHLWPSFRVLQSLAYELKQKNPALRRNVLFDDVARDLKMDFSNNGTEWKSVSPAEARKSLQKCRPTSARRLSVSAAELNELLGEKSRGEGSNAGDASMSEGEEY